MSDTRLTTTKAQPLATGAERRKTAPACDVYENDSEILLVADMPLHLPKPEGVEPRQIPVRAG